MLEKIKIEKGNKEKNVNAFCLARWTVQRWNLGSILENYTELTDLWEFVIDIVEDTEMKALIIGKQTIFKSFKLRFGWQLGERSLCQADNLYWTLQNRDLSTINAISLADIVIKK